MSNDDKFGLKTGFIGFANLGNTCYMNSSLQCLRFTMPLSEFLAKSKPLSENEMTLSYIDIVRKTWDTRRGTMTPKHFRNELTRSNMMYGGFRQHDAHEFIVHLLDTMHTSCQDKEKKSIVSEIFFGKYKQTVICPECDHSSVTQQSFMDLQVPLRKYKDENELKLSDCMNDFIEEAKLDKSNLYKCENCKDKVQVSIVTEFETMPNFLIICLKRFDINNKINTFVNFPMDQFVVNDTKYKLYAVVNHFGGKGGGHYTASVLHPNEKWYYMDDAVCRVMNAEDVVCKAAYILFFEKI